MRRKNLVILSLFISLASWSHDGLIRSLTITPARDYWQPAVINLTDPGDVVVIEFDQMGSDRSFLRYELIHCDAGWQPSNLTPSEFLDGFNEGIIEDYSYSQATSWPYVHYSFALPNERMRITAPGNYEVRIYDEQNSDVTLASARFGVCDYTMRVGADILGQTDIDSNNGHQQVSIIVDTQNEPVRDPFNDIKVVVTQNNQPETTTMVTHPMRVQSGKLYFEHLRPLIFPAGNEYHRFEVTSTATPGLNVDYIDYQEPYYIAVLKPDEPRREKMYLYDESQFGRFLPRAIDGFEPDYVQVFFTLQCDPMPGVDVFIDGELTGRKFSPENRMSYDYETGAYRGSLFLKQGYYEYRYVGVPQGDIDGNFSETQNQYTISVYHRPVGTRYDRLVGYGTFSNR